MGNKEQIQALEDKEYTGMYSFEPFPANAQTMPLDGLKEATQTSLAFMTG